MNLDLNEEQKLIQQTAREFAAAELAPVAAQLDQGGDQQPFFAWFNPAPLSWVRMSSKNSGALAT